MTNRRGIRFGELRIGETAKRHLAEVVDHNWASAGPKVWQFERDWGVLFGYKHNLAVSSGTDADINAIASLHALGAKRGDEVIVPALCFISVSNAVLAAGFTPTFVDVRRETLNVDPEKIEEKISPRTRAVVAVHTMGKPCDMDAIGEIAAKHDLLVIEDCCEAHGAAYRGEFVGHWGDAATFSFYAAHLICCGEGGMVSTNRRDVAESVLATRSHGRVGGGTWFDHDRIGFNSKMNDMEASLGLEGVESFWDTFNVRKANLDHLLAGCRDLEEYAWFNRQEPHEVCSPHAFAITLKDPRWWDCGKLRRFLEGRNIQCKRTFGCIPTQHRAYEFMGHERGKEFLEAEHVGDNGLHFGVHRYLQKEDLDWAIESLHDYFKKA